MLQPQTYRTSLDFLTPIPNRKLPARAPSFSDPSSSTTLSLSSTSSNPYALEIISLHNIGWNLSNIANHILTLQSLQDSKTTEDSSNPSFPKAHHLVKHIVQSRPQMTFQQMLQHIPFCRLVPDNLGTDFKVDQLRRLDPDYPKERLSSFDIHMIKILAMIGWKKKTIASTFRVSSVLISVYTQDLEPYSVDELKDLFPLLFVTAPTPNIAIAKDSTENI